METQNTKAIVLSSGGVDSTTAIAYAIDKHGCENVDTVSVFYGQRHDKELECAKAIAEYYKVPHYELDLSEVFKLSNCSLLASSDEEIPEMSYAEQIETNGEGKVSTYVPFRNGLMLSAVASLAISLHPDSPCTIYIGAHADDAAGEAYADCSEDFIYKISRAILAGTYNQVEVQAPFVKMNKAEVVAQGLQLNVPYNLTWSCYKGQDKACGKCGTCIDRKAAFEANNTTDPIEYEE